MDADDLPGCGKLVLYGVLGFFALWIFFFVIGVVSLPFQAASAVKNTASGVISRTMNPDNALMHYRWFHDASSRLDNFPATIAAATRAKKYAEKNAPERAMARETELIGLVQTCISLVSDYNSRAQRIDAGLFRNPERYFVITAPNWGPLPQSYPTTLCNEASDE